MSKKVETERKVMSRFLKNGRRSVCDGRHRAAPVTAPAGELHKRATVAAVSVAVTSQPRSAKTSCIAAALRDLWVGHIFWVRNVSIAIFNTNDVAMNAAERQAVSNAKSIAATIEPFYGVAAKEAFFQTSGGSLRCSESLSCGDGRRQHFRSGECDAVPHLECQGDCYLFEQGKSIPSEGRTARLLLAHGGHHIQQIQELKDRKYDAEAKTWEDMKDLYTDRRLATADALAKQFTKEFS